MSIANWRDEMIEGEMIERLKNTGVKWCGVKIFGVKSMELKRSRIVIRVGILIKKENTRPKKNKPKKWS